MGGTITLFSKKVYSESAKTWTRYTFIGGIQQLRGQDFSFFGKNKIRGLEVTNKIIVIKNNCYNKYAWFHWQSLTVSISSVEFRSRSSVKATWSTYLKCNSISLSTFSWSDSVNLVNILCFCAPLQFLSNEDTIDTTWSSCCSTLTPRRKSKISRYDQWSSMALFSCSH